MPSSALTVHRLGQGKPVVFLHGWGTSSLVWQTIIAAIHQKMLPTYSAYLVDLPGYGTSPSINPYSAINIVHTLRSALTRELAHGPIALVGWSWGGQLAMAWAAHYPQEISKLALIATSPRWIVAPDWVHAIPSQHLERFHDELQTSYKLTIQRFLHLQVLGSSAERATLAFLKASILQSPPPQATALSEGLNLLRDGDWRSCLAKLVMPCLVTAGGRDRLAPWQASEWMSQQLPNADWHYLEEAGHAPFLSHPNEFVDRLWAFLND